MNWRKGCKAMAVLSLAILLSGCFSTFSGEYSTEPTDKKGVAGQSKTKKTKKSQAVAVSDDGKEVLMKMAENEGKKLDLELLIEKNKASDSPCLELTPEQIDNLKAVPQDTYLENIISCKRETMLTSALVGMTEAFKMLAQGDSDMVGVAKAYGLTTRSVASEGTKKVQAFTSFGLGVKVSHDTSAAIQNSHNTLRDVGVSASENSGDITSNVAINTSQSASAPSNDGGSSSGSATGGGDGSTATGTGTGGSGSGVASNDSAGDTINVNVGPGSINTATDAARVNANTRDLQVAEPSANATQLNEDARSSGLLNADENTDSALDSNDSDGNFDL